MEGLLNSIYMSGDSKETKSAFIVINTKEEYAFLQWIGLQFIEQSLIKADGLSFDLMKAKEKESQKEHNLYFNISLAFNSIKNMFK